MALFKGSDPMNLLLIPKAISTESLGEEGPCTWRHEPVIKAILFLKQCTLHIQEYDLWMHVTVLPLCSDGAFQLLGELSRCS